MTDPRSPRTTGDAAVDRLLASYIPPPLPAGFGDDVMARLAAREAGLPPAPARRHSRAHQLWRRSSRALVGSAIAGLMTATAAAAAGVFGDLGVTIPAWQRTVERVTGLELAEAEPRRATTAAPAKPEADPVAAPRPTLREIAADGKISSRAELEAAGEAIDARRAERRARNRARIEAAVAAHLERRRAQGLPVPSDAERAAIRARIEARLAERDAVQTERRARLREQLGERIDAGEAIELRRPVDAAQDADAAPAADANTPPRWRDMTPAERRARWRELRRSRDAAPEFEPSQPSDDTGAQ